jgi:hypothetical protein
MEELSSKTKNSRKLVLFSISLVILLSMLYFQGKMYSNLTPTTLLDADETILQRKALTQVSIGDTNQILWLSLILAFVNTLLYKNWVKAEKWVLQPVLFFVLTFGLALTLNVKRTFKVRGVITKMEMKG